MTVAPLNCWIKLNKNYENVMNFFQTVTWERILSRMVCISLGVCGCSSIYSWCFLSVAVNLSSQCSFEYPWCPLTDHTSHHWASWWSSLPPWAYPWPPGAQGTQGTAGGAGGRPGGTQGRRRRSCTNPLPIRQSNTNPVPISQSITNPPI